MMRRVSLVVALVAILLCANQTFADSLNLTLLGAKPTGTVYMNSTLLGGYSGANFYAGVLNWTDTPGSSVPNYFTYCIDISAVIDISHNYSFNMATPSTVLSQQVVNGIVNLWNAHHDAFAVTLSHPPTGSDLQAEELQIALWDLIYNGTTTALLDGSSASSPLYFHDANPSAGLSTALQWAQDAFTTSSTPGLMPSDFQVLEAQGPGRNQLFLGLTPTGNLAPVGAPLPTSALAGALLLTLLAAHGVLKAQKGTGPISPIASLC
jgi:hypothetical protein